MAPPTPTSDGDSLASRLELIERQVELLRSAVEVERDVGLPAPLKARALDLAPADAPDELRERAGRDHLPIPPVSIREGYNPNDDFRYWEAGLIEHDKVVAAADRAGVTGTRVFDFGGSTGRVFRHFYCQDRRWEVWSSDFKLRTFRWNQQHFPRDIRVTLNTFLPQLPFPDAQFDIIMAFSVFTHIDELEIPWLLELRRVLAPGGLLYVTIHDEAYWESRPEKMTQRIQSSANGAGITSESPFPRPRAAYHHLLDTHYSCNVFHSTDYVLGQWGRYFDIFEIRPMSLAASMQCAVMLTR